MRLLDEHKGALCVNALAQRPGGTQSAVSQRMRVLQSGLVHSQRRGYPVHCLLDRDRLEQYKVRLSETLGEERQRRTFPLWAELLDQGEKIAYLERFLEKLQEEAEALKERIATLKELVPSYKRRGRSD